ncbi:MAG: acyltransferase, partial [Mucinivorans sp.]
RGSLVKWSAILNVSPMNKFELGSHSVIENFSLIDNGVGDVTIGAHSRVGLRNTVIGPVTIGCHVITAQNVVLSGLNHN